LDRDSGSKSQNKSKGHTGDAHTDLFAYVIRKYFQEGGRQLEHRLLWVAAAENWDEVLVSMSFPRQHLGIEISAELVPLASERAAEFPHIQYRQADLNTGELGPAQYDLVIAHQSLHHVLNRKRSVPTVCTPS